MPVQAAEAIERRRLCKSSRYFIREFGANANMLAAALASNMNFFLRFELARGAHDRAFTDGEVLMWEEPTEIFALGLAAQSKLLERLLAIRRICFALTSSNDFR